MRVHPLSSPSSDVVRRRWLVAALSSTALPAGHSGRVAIVDCGLHAPLPPPGAIAVPPGLRAWLLQHTGTVYVTP